MPWTIAVGLWVLLVLEASTQHVLKRGQKKHRDHSDRDTAHPVILIRYFGRSNQLRLRPHTRSKHFRRSMPSLADAITEDVNSKIAEHMKKQHDYQNELKKKIERQIENAMNFRKAPRRIGNSRRRKPKKYRGLQNGAQNNFMGPWMRPNIPQLQPYQMPLEPPIMQELPPMLEFPSIPELPSMPGFPPLPGLPPMPEFPPMSIIPDMESLVPAIPNGMSNDPVSWSYSDGNTSINFNYNPFNSASINARRARDTRSQDICD